MDPNVPPPTVTPGTSTTEYWVTLAHTAFQVITGFLALFHPGFTINPDVQKFVLAEVPLLLSVNGAFYAHARTQVKVAALSAVAQQATVSASAWATQSDQQTAKEIAAIQSTPAPVYNLTTTTSTSPEAAPAGTVPPAAPVEVPTALVEAPASDPAAPGSTPPAL